MSIKNIAQKYNLLILCGVIMLIWGFFGFITDGGFLSARNISNLFRQMSVVGILSLGMAFVIITGNIELSVGSMLSLLGAIGAIMLQNSFPLPIVLLSMILVGTVFGGFNGYWYAYRGVPSFIVTLAGLLIYRGIVLFITKGQTIQINNDIFTLIGNGSLSQVLSWSIFGVIVFFYGYFQIKKYSQTSSLKNINLVSILLILFSFSFIFLLNSYRGVPIPLLILAILFFTANFILEKTSFGRTVYAIGGNAEAAKYSGINTKKFYLLVFVFNGMIVSIASMINTARLASAVPSTGTNTELDAIAACVIGGISLVGGQGTIIGAVLGALIIASINNGMSFIGLDSAWQNTVKGMVLLLAVWIDVSSRENN